MIQLQLNFNISVTAKLLQLHTMQSFIFFIEFTLTRFVQFEGYEALKFEMRLFFLQFATLARERINTIFAKSLF